MATNNTEQLTSIVQQFYGRHSKFQEIKKKYEALKGDFEQTMLEYFDGLGKSRKTARFDGGATNPDAKLVVTKVERTKVEWLPEKLKQKVPRELHKRLFKKRYEITDMPNLVKYLKSCGVDPKIFKAFVAVEETVDEKALDQLDDEGLLTLNMISGCYMVHCQKPYFTLKLERANADGEQE